ncbi:hypothetical protein BH09PSE4_BH09PSE4_22870 [soil metagenome]
MTVDEVWAAIRDFRFCDGRTLNEHFREGNDKIELCNRIIALDTRGVGSERIAEVLAGGDGFWRPCSGCQESSEGVVSTEDYPYSATFQCQPGGGCRECGGIGVLWDTTDYEAMARDMLAEDEAERAALISMREQLRAEIINAPEIADFMAGVPLEAAHQRERWPSRHDAGKQPEDWLFLIGYLAGKACSAQRLGDTEKALHHTISSAAALANWHLALSGTDTRMRPGIASPAWEASALRHFHSGNPGRRQWRSD